MLKIKAGNLKIKAAMVILLVSDLHLDVGLNIKPGLFAHTVSRVFLWCRGKQSLALVLMICWNLFASHKPYLLRWVWKQYCTIIQIKTD